MTKTDVMPDVDWKRIRRATSIKLFMNDERRLLLQAFDYWYGNDDMTDVVDGAVYAIGAGADDVGEYLGNEVTYLPNPSIKKIEIVETQDAENHGSHPEISYEQKSINEIYGKTE